MKTGSMIFVAFLLVGCGREQTSVEKVEGKSMSQQSVFEQLSDDAVLVSADDAKIDKKTLLSWIALREKVTILGAPSGMEISPEQVSFAKFSVLAGVTNAFIRETALLKYAAKNGIKPSQADINRCKRGFASTIRAAKSPWKVVLERFPVELRATIEDRVEKESTGFAVKRDFLEKTDVMATQEEIDKYFDRYVRYNNDCAATNAAVWCMASNIWQQALSGVDFVDLAKKYSEDENQTQNAKWDSFKLEDLKDYPDVYRLQRFFKRGYVSPPVEGDNGLMIVRIDEVMEDGEEVEDEDYTSTPDTEYGMSRIFLHLPLFIETVTKDEFARQATEAKKIKAFEDMVHDLIGEMHIEFPSGVDVFAPTEKDTNDIKSIH